MKQHTSTRLWKFSISCASDSNLTLHLDPATQSVEANLGHQIEGKAAQTTSKPKKNSDFSQEGNQNWKTDVRPVESTTDQGIVNSEEPLGSNWNRFLCIPLCGKSVKERSGR